MVKVTSVSAKPTTHQVLLPLNAPACTAQGKHKSLKQPTPFACLLHPFATMLDQWMHGVPVDCGHHWSLQAIEMALNQGAHPSGTTAE